MAFLNSPNKSATEFPLPRAESDDEESFVVLEDPEESIRDLSTLSVTPPLRVNKVREMQSLIKTEIALQSEPVVEVPKVDPVPSVASNLAKMNISPDSSYEEIQKHVEELIKENETLKNTIIQNNMSMKTNYDRFLAYKEEVDTVMKKNKEMFNEAKGIIEKLKEENAKLVGDVEVHINLKKLHEEEIINLKEKLKTQLSVSSIIDTKPGVVSNGLNDKIENLQTALEDSNKKIAELSIENAQLKAKEQDFNKKIDELQITLNGSNNSSEEINNLQEELVLKEKKIDQLKERVVQISKVEEQLQTKQQQFYLLEFENSTLKQRMSTLEYDNNKLTSQLQKLSEESRKNTSAEVDFEHKMKLKDEDIKSLLLQLKEAKRNIQKSDALIKEKCEMEEHVVQMRRQLSISQKTITALEEEREEKIAKIENLRQLLQKSENDELFALKEQLQLYKDDFEAEKEAKTTLQRERDQIAQDLQNVQTRNKQLQTEVETLRARIQPKSEGYSCPKCSFGFQSYEALENHVHRCLELDDIS